MLDQHEQQIVDDIASVGWSMIAIPDDDEGPGFAYSIGIQPTFGHPEIIVFGLPIDTMFTMINLAGEEIRNGRKFDEAIRHDCLLDGVDCRFSPVLPSLFESYFGYALWHCQHRGAKGELRAMQCVWPDKMGLFPDERSCHPEVVRRQPLLNRA